MVPSCLNRIQRLNVPLPRTAKKKPVYLENFVVLHIHIGELGASVWFCVVEKLAVGTLTADSSRERYARGVSFLIRKIHGREFENWLHLRVRARTTNQRAASFQMTETRKEDMRRATDGDTTKIRSIRACRVYSGRLPNQ